NREAVLSALDHVLARIAEEEAACRIGVVSTTLSEESAQILAATMATTKFKYHSAWADGLREDGRGEGVEGGDRGGAREAVLAVLAARSLEPTAAQRALVETCAAHGRLRAWRRAAVTAASSDEVFGEPERGASPPHARSDTAQGP